MGVKGWDLGREEPEPEFAELGQDGAFLGYAVCEDYVVGRDSVGCEEEEFGGGEGVDFAHFSGG